jgi:hypothetical protein
MPWRSFFATSELYDDYVEWARAQRFERVLARETFGREMRKLGLRWQRRALASQGAPAQAEDVPGFQMPETVQDFETLVRRAAGVLDEEDEGQEQAA